MIVRHLQEAGPGGECTVEPRLRLLEGRGRRDLLSRHGRFRAGLFRRRPAEQQCAVDVGHILKCGGSVRTRAKTTGCKVIDNIINAS